MQCPQAIREAEYRHHQKRKRLRTQLPANARPSPVLSPTSPSSTSAPTLPTSIPCPSTVWRADVKGLPLADQPAGSPRNLPRTNSTGLHRFRSLRLVPTPRLCNGSQLHPVHLPGHLPQGGATVPMDPSRQLHLHCSDPTRYRTCQRKED